MKTISVPTSEYLRLRKIEGLYRRKSVPTPTKDTTKADAFLSQWTGAFETVSSSKTQDKRLLAIHKKHVK